MRTHAVIYQKTETRDINALFLLSIILLSLIGCSGSERDLVEAAGRGDASTVQKLLKQGITANAKYVTHYSALMAASKRGHTDVIKLLLKYKAKVDAADKGGLTALMIATIAGCSDSAILLLKAGADPTLKNNAGQNVYVMAQKYNRIEIMELLELTANGLLNEIPDPGDIQFGPK